MVMVFGNWLVLKLDGTNEKGWLRCLEEYVLSIVFKQDWISE